MSGSTIPASTMVIVSDATQSIVETVKRPKVEKTATIKELEESGQLAYWGEDNLWPQNLITDVRKNDLIPVIVEKKTKLLYSGGVVYGNVVVNDDGSERMVRKLEPEIERWLNKTRVNRYLYEAGYDKYMFSNFYPELVQGSLGDKSIARIYCHDASEVRLSKQNKQGRIHTAYLSANWDGSDETNTSKLVKLPVLDPYFDVAEQIRESDSSRWILPMRNVHMGNKFYDVPAFNGIRLSKWLELAQSIPEFKRALMKNQMTIKYHIEVDEGWWDWRYPKWKEMSETNKKKAMKEEVQAFEKFMKGESNAGNTILTAKRTDPHNPKNEWSQWKIHELKMQIPEGIYIEDSQEIDFHIARAFGLEPTLIGISPSRSKQSAGSGSDKRVARLNHLLDTKPDQDQILEPLQVVSELNGWDERFNDGMPLQWWCKNYYVATMDKSSNVQQNTED